MSLPMKHWKKLAGGASGLALVAVTWWALPGLSAPKSTAVSDLDKNFLIAANESNLSEVAYAPAVMKRASSASAKNFARHMVQDHSKANHQLTLLARRLGVKLPQQVPSDEQAVINRLAQERGSKFDKAYQNEMIRDHNEDISDAERELSLGSNEQVKTFAAQLLVTLRGHLYMARTMYGGMRRPMRHPSMDDEMSNSVSGSVGNTTSEMRNAAGSAANMVSAAGNRVGR